MQTTLFNFKCPIFWNFSLNTLYKTDAWYNVHVRWHMIKLIWPILPILWPNHPYFPTPGVRIQLWNLGAQLHIESIFTINSLVLLIVKKILWAFDSALGKEHVFKSPFRQWIFGIAGPYWSQHKDIKQSTLFHYDCFRLLIQMVHVYTTSLRILPILLGLVFVSFAPDSVSPLA